MGEWVEEGGRTLGTACMVAEGFYEVAETPQASMLGELDGDARN